MSADSLGGGAIHRASLALMVHVGVKACVCRNAGVVGRGPLTYDATGRYGVGSKTFTVADVTSITIERDLVTIHLGELA
jgi:hypothetical protein